MTKSLNSIQYLRGIAALLVVLVHVPVQLERMGYQNNWPDWFNMGVDIFFVISGFIMWTTTQGTAITPTQFLQRRFARIVPLYWLLTTITVIMMTVAPSLLQSGQFDLAHIVKSYLFIGAEHPVTHKMQPVLVPGWTLNLEMFFYVIFALALYLPARFRAGATVVSLTAIVACSAFFPNPNSFGGFYTSDIILEFVYGIVLGVAFTHWKRVPAVRSTVLVGLICAVVGVILVASDLPRAISYGVPALMLVGGALVAESSGWVGYNRPLHAIGDASYSLYLTHGMLLSAAGQAWRKSGAANLPFSGALFTIVSVVFVTVAAIAVYRWLERPMQLMLRGIGRGGTMVAASRA